MIYNTITPCKKKKGFEGIPEKYYQVPLKELGDSLTEDLNSYKLVRETKIMLVLKEKEGKNKISIYPSSRVFVYGDLDKEEAKNIMNTISKTVEKIIAS
ncbi:MAG: hypothetical protein KAS63_01105 [Candidatus Heimdallarchaeota archaeon]|nr:hypothetical protein [Candidatus Heimdallarchaeota archaeon]MCK4953941.1 hypothetical protein [Candidatus Heimdallarchaeota archaeon]